MNKKFINEITNLLTLANLTLKEETTKEEVFPSILLTIRRLEDLNQVSSYLSTTRNLFLKFDSVKKYYLKHEDKFVLKDELPSLLNEEESISCFISDCLSKRNELVFFSDGLYEGFYFMKLLKDGYNLLIDDKVKYVLKISKNKFKLFDEEKKLILQAKAKSERNIKFKVNETKYDFVFNKKFNSFEIYLKDYLSSLKKEEANYEENALGVFEGKILKVKHIRMDKNKFVISKTTYFKDLEKDNVLLNIISYGLISISRNLLLKYYK